MAMGGPGMRRGGGCGCSTILMAIVIMIIAMSAISFFSGIMAPTQWLGQSMGPAQVTPSTRERDALPANAANDAGPLFTDNLGWIDNASRMNAGLRNFHRATGVRPHVYIVGEINGNSTPTPAQVEAFAAALYDELFTDEAHLLFVFFESGEWPNNFVRIQTQPGSQARLVMDAEAQNILIDYIEYYNERFINVGDVSMEQVFSNAFDEAAQRIMHRAPDNRPFWITVIIVAGVLLLALILFKWWKRKQDQKNLEAEQTERILNQDFGTFGGNAEDEASRLARQYKDDGSNNS